MKKLNFILISFMLSLPVMAEVSLQDCLDDASLQGDSKTPQQPLPECSEIIKSEGAHVSVTSSEKFWKAFGIANMIYIDSLDEKGNLESRELLSGSQTELVAVKNIFIDSLQKKLFVIQAKNNMPELLIYNLEFVGNVSPLKVMRNEIFRNVSSVRMKTANVIEVISPDRSFVINADGESRTELSSKKALTIHPQ